MVIPVITEIEAEERPAARARRPELMPALRSTRHGGHGPFRRVALRALRLAAASMRKLSRHRGPLRPVLRLLRPRARARLRPADLVAAVAAGSTCAAGGGADRRHLVGGHAPGQIARRRESPAAKDWEDGVAAGPEANLASPPCGEVGLLAKRARRVGSRTNQRTGKREGGCAPRRRWRAWGSSEVRKLTSQNP